jgi:hypothetical protein
MDDPRLQARLRRLGRRIYAIGAGSGFGWGLAACVAIGLLCAWTDLIFELSPAFRRATAILIWGAGLAVTIGIAARVARGARSHELAKRLDEAAEAKGEIVSGVDLWNDRRAFSPLEEELVRIAIGKAGEIAEQARDRQAAPAKPAVVALMAAGLLAVAVTLIAALAPKLALAQWLRFSDPYGDHPPYSPYTFHVEPGDARVVYGQGIEVRATVEGPPIDRLELILQPDGGGEPERLPMFPEEQGRWRASVADVTTPGRYLVEAKRARSARHRIDVIMVPQLSAVRFRVTPPPYTRRPIYEGPLPKDGLSGLPGARVEVWASSNRPLASGSVRIASRRGGGTIPLTPSASEAREVSGAFEIREDTTIEIRVRDVAGQESPNPFTAPVALLRDDRPFVRIIEPRETSFATADVSLPIELAAEDDYGLARIQLFRALNGSRPSPVDLALPPQPQTRWQERTYLPLPGYGLKAGDEIKLFARVEDNDPAGAKGSESAIVTVKIIPREVLERLLRTREGMEVLASKYREAERRLESLADEIAKLQEELARLAPDDPLAKSHEQALQALSKRLDEEASAIRESAKHLIPYDVDRRLSRELEALADRLEGENRLLAGRPNQKNSDAAKRLAALRKQFGRDRERFEHDALEPIEFLARIYPLFEDQSRFVQLYLRQRDLAERAAALKGHDRDDDPRLKGRMRDLEAEQKEIRNALARLLEDIEEHARLLPDDPKLTKLKETAELFVAAARSCGATEAMIDAEGALAEFVGTRAHASAKEAADLLEKLIARCRGNGDFAGQTQGALAFRPTLSEAIGQSIEQMLAEAGLPGQGIGGNAPGLAGGYSSRRSTLNNVGLYGNMPTASSSRSGSGRSATGAGSFHDDGPNADRRPLETVDGDRGASASGHAEAAIPAQYRRRVADYFQRIADETGGR